MSQYGMLSRAVATLGVAVLVAATYFYIRAIREEALNLQPLSLLISLVAGVIRTPNFRTHFDSNYEIGVDWDAKASTQRTGPMLVDMSWQIFEGANIAAEGKSEDSPGLLEEPGILYERRIGSIRAQKGHEYTLILHVNRDASGQNVAHPRIVVQVPKLLWEDHAMGVDFQKLIAGVLGIVGITCLKLERTRSQRADRVDILHTNT